MILKGVKQQFNRKYLKKLLSERQVDVSNTEIGSLGVILNIDDGIDPELFMGLSEFLNIRHNKLKIIAFTENKEPVSSTWATCFNAKDFGWNGVVKNVELKSFLDIKFDVLISYYDKEILEMKLLTALSKSYFKIGILQTDERLNDLIIKTRLKEFEVFKEEVFKYLTVLNKIKK